MRLAVITPSYFGDFERCRLLCDSVDRFLDPSVEHVLVVDGTDEALFAPLANERRRVVVFDPHRPRWLKRLGRRGRWWVSLRTPPVRSWVYQQIKKLSAPDYCDADAYLFIDSDIALVRPMAIDEVVRGDRVRLYANPTDGQKPMHARWHRAAAKLLGLPPRDYHGADFINPLVSWRRDVLLELRAALPKRPGGDWRLPICRQAHFSEYILYGVFAQHVLDDDDRHWLDPAPICHNSWDYAINNDDGSVNDAELARLFDEVTGEHPAVLVQSARGVDAAAYADQLRAVQERLAGGAVAAGGVR